MAKLFGVSLALVVLISTAVNGIAEEDYYAKYEEAIKQLQEEGLLNDTSLSAAAACEKSMLRGSDFNCYIDPDYKKKAENVNELTPYDIKIVAAMGDSVTAAFAARACNILQILTESRGVSWSIGGEKEISESTTLPNIIKKYSKDVVGFSVGNGGKDSPNAKLNVAVSGAIAQDMLSQALKLVDKIKEIDNYDEKWKLVTLWIGGNNLCAYCNDPIKHSPQNYVNSIGEALNYLKEHLTKTFVNLVQIVDISKLDSNIKCNILHLFACPCKNDDETKKATAQYQEELNKLANEDFYHDSDMFTVVLQPFMADITVPSESDKYFAPDCFHFSTLGHKEGAVALWKNMLEPVGKKSLDWTPDAEIECPKSPYFYTRKNSLKKVSSSGEEDTSNQNSFPQRSDNNVVIIAGAVVGVAVVLIALVVMTIAVGMFVRRKNQLSIRAENTPLVG